MRLVTSPVTTLSSSQIATAAKSIVAAQFALCGFDVLEQAGRVSASYDLGVARSGGMMKVSVHASVDGYWNLVDRFLDPPQLEDLRSHDYHRAIQQWLEQQSSQVVCGLVQFESENLQRMPRIYLANVYEIAEKLHENTYYLGDSALYEQYEITDQDGVHRIERLPSTWRISHTRIATLMHAGDTDSLQHRFSEATQCAPCAQAAAAACVQCLPMMN